MHAPSRHVLALAMLAACFVAAPAFAQVSLTQGEIKVRKFYDANANGVQDAGEPGLRSWEMTLTRPDATTSTRWTGAVGNTVWGLLAPGSEYSVAEGVPNESGWVQSAPRDALGNPINPSAVTVVACKTTWVKFGNYCTKGSGGRTPGFWSNKNGQARFNDEADGPLEELALLGALNLVDADGNAFDPASYAAFDTWLLDGMAVNMAYKLSTQLAATALNVEAGFVNGTLTYVPCGCTINELIADANASLGSNPLTVEASAARAEQEQLKDWLDQLNNGALVVSPRPCSYSFTPPAY